jgi:iron complex transport system substrate-binding protein
MNGWTNAALVVALLAAMALRMTSADAATKPERIVSINACADQYLLKLIPRERILALSPFSRDPASSYFAKRAQGIPQVNDDAESVLRLRPDLVIASRFNNALTLRLLRDQGLRVLALDHPATFEEARAQMIRVAKALGVPERGAAMARRFDAALARAKGAARHSGTGPLSIIYYDRGGYALGQGSLSTQILAHMDLRNAAADLGIGAIAPVSIETVLAARPDLLVVPGGMHAVDRGSALLAHPALKRMYPPEMRLRFPGRSVVCPGPSLIPGLDALVKAMTRTLNSLH